MRTTSPEYRFLCQALVGVAFLGLVAIASLPAARGAGPVGWMPLWLLGMPLAALAALVLAQRRQRVPQAAAPARPAAASRRARPVQARRRMAPRPASPRRRAVAPAA